MTSEVPAPTVPGTHGRSAGVGREVGRGRLIWESQSGKHGPDPERKRDGRRTTLVWDALRQVLTARVAETGRTALDIVDAGGGTGGFAVPFAALGHNVTVVDPSPDALAAARRRAAERNVRLTAVQGDADGLDALIGQQAADLVICHSVLEYVDSPAAAMAAIARVLRPGATVSVLAANAVAAVLQSALAGRYAEAGQLLAAASADSDRPEGTRGRPTGECWMPDRVSGSGISQGAPDTAPPDTGPAGRRRFTLAGLTALIEGAGLRAGDAHGIRVFSGLLPAAEPDPAAAEALLALEDAAATYPALRDIAARLHVLGVAMPDPGNLSGIERRSGGRPPVPPGK